jgi:uncharacterized protein (DUF1697 family)
LTRYAAFLRAINVGGRYVTMDRLREAVTAAGVSKVQTFIASGNVIFETARRTPPAIEGLLERQLERALGYRVATFVRTMPELAAMADRSPFEEEGGTTYVLLLKEAPPAEAARRVRALSTDVDRLEVVGREIYWLCRTSFGQSTVAGGALEKILSGEATARNISTIRRMRAKFAAGE